MLNSETPEQWSLRTWRERHENGYFPRSEQHAEWRVFDFIPVWLASRVCSSDVCLEIGCGYGEWMIPLSRNVKAVVGYDIHPEPINKGMDLVRARGLKNVHLALSNGLTLPCLSRMYSLVYSISVFQHLPRTIVAGYLRETVRVLAEGGRALHHFRNADHVGNHPPLATNIETNHKGDFSVGWTAQEIQGAAITAGLKVDDVVPDDNGLFLILVARV